MSCDSFPPHDRRAAARESLPFTRGQPLTGSNTLTRQARTRPTVMCRRPGTLCIGAASCDGRNTGLRTQYSHNSGRPVTQLASSVSTCQSWNSPGTGPLELSRTLHLVKSLAPRVLPAIAILDVSGSTGLSPVVPSSQKRPMRHLDYAVSVSPLTSNMSITAIV